MTPTRIARSILAIALTAALTSGLVACSRTTSATGESGLSSVDASGSPLPSGAPTLAPAPTQTKGKGSGHPNGGGGGGGTSGSTNTATASASTSPSSVRTGLHLIGDYRIVVIGPCYWALDGAGELLVGTRFKVTFNGLLGAATVPFVMTDDKDHDSSTSPGVIVGTVFPAAVGADQGSSARYPGQTVTVTGTINPIGRDSNSANNSISIGVKVPTENLPTSTTPVNIPCVG